MKNPPDSKPLKFPLLNVVNTKDLSSSDSKESPSPFHIGEELKSFLLISFLVFTFCLFPLQAFSFDVDESVLYYPEPEEPQHKEEIEFYINKFCINRGRSFVRIQNRVVVDCMTSKVLWKVSYADEWAESLAEALKYPIYDDYRGDEKHAPISGVVLVQEDADDYKNMLELKQLVKHYHLPVRLTTMENYGVSSQDKPKSKFIKNFQIDFGY